MAFTTQNDFVNTSMRAFIEGHNRSTEIGHIEPCASSTGVRYKYNGLLETFFWAFASIVVTSLNSYCIYSNNINNRQRTIYSVLSDSLMASNVFTGVVVYSIFAYLSQNHVEDCTLLVCFMGCCIYNLMSTLLSISLITINRFKILSSASAMPSNRFFRNTTTNKTYCIHFSIAFVSLAITLIRVFFPMVGAIMVNMLSAVFGLIIIIFSCIIHSKLKSISDCRGDNSIPGESAVNPYKQSLHFLKLMILSMVFLWLPLVVVAAIIHVFGLQNKAVALSITLKLFWLRPIVDPVAYLAFVLKRARRRRTTVVYPIAIKNDHQIHNIQNTSAQEEN